MLLLLFFFLSPTYFVQFSDLSGIEEGMYIYYSTIKIGRVEEITIKDLKPAVKISIKRKYKDLIREDCALRFLNGKLELIFVEKENPSLPPGSVIKGIRNQKEEFVFRFNRMKKKFKDSKAHDILEEILFEMEKAYEKGKEEFKEKWPIFKEKLKNLKEKIKGDEKMEKELDKTIEEGDKKSTT